MTPFEKLYGEKPNLAGLPEWGQITWVHNTTGSKLDAHAKRAQWVGFDYQSTHAHRIFWPEKNIISVECDIKFAQQTTSSQKQVDTIPKQVSNIQVDNVPHTPSPPILPSVPHQSGRSTKPSQIIQEIEQGKFTTTKDTDEDYTAVNACDNIQCPQKCFKCFGCFDCSTCISLTRVFLRMYIGLLESP